MGSDIVIRLRTWPNAVDAVSAFDLMNEAANVIESLRTEIRTQRKEIAALRAEQAVVQGAERPFRNEHPEGGWVQ